MVIKKATMVVWFIEVCSLVAIFVGGSIAWFSFILYLNTVIMSDNKPTFKDYLVTVSYDLFNPLGNQLNLPATEQSITFIARTVIELTSDALLEVAQQIVKIDQGRGLAKNFKISSYSGPLTSKFFAKNDTPIIVKFGYPPVAEKPIEEK